jgi:hypothetical protein
MNKQTKQDPVARKQGDLHDTSKEGTPHKDDGGIAGTVVQSFHQPQPRH